MKDYPLLEEVSRQKEIKIKRKKRLENKVKEIFQNISWTRKQREGKHKRKSKREYEPRSANIQTVAVPKRTGVWGSSGKSMKGGGPNEKNFKFKFFFTINENDKTKWKSTVHF